MVLLLGNVLLRKSDAFSKMAESQNPQIISTGNKAVQ